MAGNSKQGQPGSVNSGIPTAGINPVNRTTSPQSKGKAVGVDLSPFVGLGGDIKNLDKKLETFIGKLDQLTNNIVTAINNQKSTSIQQPPNQQGPQFGERTPDINDSKNSGTADFNRELLASIKKQSESSRIIIESLIPNVEEIKNSIVNSIENNKVSSGLDSNPAVSSALESSQLTAEQISVFETFSDSIIAGLQPSFDQMISSQKEMATSIQQYHISNTQTNPNLNQQINQSIDKSQLAETTQKLNDIAKQTSQVSPQSTERKVEVVEKHITTTVEQPQQEVTGYKVNPLREQDQQVSIPSATNYFGGNERPITLNTAKSALMGDDTLTVSDQPDFIRSEANRPLSVDNAITGDLNVRQTVPLYNSEDLNSLLTKSEYPSSKGVRRAYHQCRF